MRITLLQTDIIWGKPYDNMDFAEKMLAQAPHSDVYVLPEMWSTGFITEQDIVMSVAGKGADDAWRWMMDMSEKTGAAICGSIAVGIGDGKYANRLLFARPDGTADIYDKRHLFSYGNEDVCYTPGKRRSVAEYKGVRFLLAICYDLRFPVWMRCRNDYDAIITVANWPESRKDVWRTLLKARALENQCYVIGCNRTGCDPKCRYGGGSVIISPKGKILAESQTECGQAVTADICIEEQNMFRNKFRTFDDMDRFIIEY